MDQAGHPYQLTFQAEKNPWYFSFLLPLYVVISFLYLYIVFGLTIDWRIWFVPLIFLAEIYRILFSLIAFLCSKTIQYPLFRPGQRNYLVDALIPTLSEPRSIVEMTTKGALAMRGVNKVYVLDDGNRPEIRQMAEELGAEYLARQSSNHAKAGNMNYGLKFSKADFVVSLDADHIPRPEFIERTIGYFDDAKLAFVQTPQSFYNINSIQHRVVKDYSLWNEQTMFYESIQPAKNTFNAAFFCGSSAILRREALDSVGGFATGTATEDIHTSVRLHSKGWKSLFINERLAFGLAAEDLKEYHKQRVRWGAGSLGLLFRTSDSPLIIKNLSVMQRLCYVNSTLAYMQGHFKLFYYLLPIYIILIPIKHLSLPVVAYLFFYLPYVVITFWIIKVYSRNTYHPLFNEQYNIANIFSNIVALKGIWKVQKKFAVAIKIKRNKENSFVFSALTGIAFLMVVAECYGVAVWIIVMHMKLDLLLESSLSLGLFWNTINLGIFLTFIYFLVTFNKKDRANADYSLKAKEVMPTISPPLPIFTN
jgi:cellulose synthase/poly-beta-1,6-N-acetylglucosamine synthase-like glycosyltransferase